jgi:Calcium-activated chloride channel
VHQPPNGPERRAQTLRTDPLNAFHSIRNLRPSPTYLTGSLSDLTTHTQRKRSPFLFVPRFLALHNAIAVRLTDWENHAHQSTDANSMTLKVFALGALVSYSGVSRSAFVYVPFSKGVMRAV